MIVSYQTESDYQKILENSHKKPIFLFKHSPTCGISAGAKDSFNKFVNKTEEAEFWQVLVVEQRPLSLEIANKTRIPHQSPQVILFHNGEPTWSVSHWSITEKRLSQALAEVQ